MLWEVSRYFKKGWIERYFIDPVCYFPYEGFYWLAPWPGQGMIIHFYVLGILAIFISIGFLYRSSIVLFFIAFSYIFLLDKTNYLNHFYLICLLSFIMIFLPANKAASVDARLFPAIKSLRVPAWTIWWLRLQLGLVYFYGGIAKLNSDWLRCEPMRMWLSRRTDFPVIGKWFTEEWMVHLFSYGGLFLDLLVAPLLIWRKTRFYALGAITSFHLLNARLFDIGIFPWFMIGATLIFLPSDFFSFLTGKSKKKVQDFKTSKWVCWGLGVYFLIQILIPFRHLLFKGNVNWTEEGHRFSWHMKLRSKSTDITYYLHDLRKNEKYLVEQESFLTPRQLEKMEDKPDMIIRFARYIAEEANKQGLDSVSVTAVVMSSLNGRPKSLLIDSTADLSRIEYGLFETADWILPLE